MKQGQARFLGSVIVAAALVGVGFWGGTRIVTSTATPQVLSGRVQEVGGSGEEFAILLNGTHEPTSYGFSDSIWWRGADDTWNSTHGTAIPCMKPLSGGQTITFGVVNTKPSAGAPGGPVVTWIECG